MRSPIALAESLTDYFSEPVIYLFVYSASPSGALLLARPARSVSSLSD